MGMIVDLAIAMVVGIRTDSFMYMDIDMSMFIKSKIPPNSIWSKHYPKSIQKLFTMVLKWVSGRFVRQKSGQKANPGPRRHRGADS